jgi:hypothetical protein
MNGKQFINTVIEDWTWFVNDQLDRIGVKQDHLAGKTQKAYVTNGDNAEKRLSDRKKQPREGWN